VIGKKAFRGIILRWLFFFGLIVTIGYILFAKAAPELELPVNFIVYLLFFLFLILFKDYRKIKKNK